MRDNHDSPAEKTVPNRPCAMDEAAKLYGIKTETLREWVRDGKVPGYRFGDRLIHVDLDEMDALYQRVTPRPKRGAR